jgi:superfamily II DNA or RNA helicase
MQWRQKQTNSAPTAKARSRPPQPERAAPPTEPPPRNNKKAGKSGKHKPRKLSHLKKPPGMSLEDWQRELRRQFGREQNYRLKNVGDHAIFSEFEVTNPQTQRTYRVHVRGPNPGDNFCSCPDFATNTLGTCKHVEFTLAALERKRGFAEQLRAGYQPEYSEVYLQYGARREVRFRAGSACPIPLARIVGRYFDDDGLLLPEAFGRFETFLGETKKIDHDVRWTDDVLSFIAEVRDAEHRQRRLEGLFPRGPLSPAFKNLLRVPLYEYQREGALFAAQAGRCLIGDEMGLGKTAQAIAAVEIMARHFGVGRVLVVCPTSLKHQWAREIERFADKSSRSVEVVNGLRARRERHFATDTFYKVMNYDTVYRDLDLIDHWAPDLVILDEAQRIKNWNTRTARSVKRIQSPYAIVLTGTPLENRLEELVSIVQFVDRYRLGPTFKLLHEHQLRDEFGKVVGYRDLDRIGKTLEPILMRRQKDQVLDQLPGRLDSNVFVPMTPLQMKHHNENLEIVGNIVQKWRRFGFLTEQDQRRLMIALQRMRMSCDNSYLVDHRTDHGVKADEATTLLEEILEDSGTKVVIFSQWLRMHELLVRQLKERGWGHVVFHGGVPGAKRKDLIDRFRDDPNCRLFLSTDAGGTGLNLQHATVVFNMDLPWNPAVLEQRVGRVHRLGQARPVRVVNFVAQGTIEEGMLQVLQFKRSLFAGVLDGGEKDVFLGGSRLNKFMESVEKATSAIPPQELLDDASEALHRPPMEGDEEEPQPTRRRGRPGRAGRPAPVPTGAGAPAAGGMPAPAVDDPWAGLLQVGMALLQQLAGAAGSGAGQGGAARPGGTSATVVRDERTGESYLKVPLPKPEVLENALKAVGALLEGLRT